MAKVVHFIAHLLGWYTGQVVSAIDDDGDTWIGFRCNTCNTVDGEQCISREKHIELEEKGFVVRWSQLMKNKIRRDNG
jgi:hypothetical protein